MCITARFAHAGGSRASRRVTRTLAIVKPDAFKNAAHIESEMKRASLKYVTKKTTMLDKDAAAQFYEEHAHVRPDEYSQRVSVISGFEYSGVSCYLFIFS